MARHLSIENWLVLWCFFFFLLTTLKGAAVSELSPPSFFYILELFKAVQKLTKRLPWTVRHRCFPLVFFHYPSKLNQQDTRHTRLKRVYYKQSFHFQEPLTASLYEKQHQHRQQQEKKHHGRRKVRGRMSWPPPLLRWWLTAVTAMMVMRWGKRKVCAAVNLQCRRAC